MSFANFDALFLARLQFAFTIGLASCLFVLDTLWLYTRRRVYEDLFGFWKTIFAVVFAMNEAGQFGLGISFHPYIVPTSFTIAEAAAPPESLAFLLVGAAVLVPVILAYTAYSYRVFRGKVRPEEGYH